MCPFTPSCFPSSHVCFFEYKHVISPSAFIPCTICHSDLWHFSSICTEEESPIKAVCLINNLLMFKCYTEHLQMFLWGVDAQSLWISSDSTTKIPTDSIILGNLQSCLTKYKKWTSSTPKQELHAYITDEKRPKTNIISQMNQTVTACDRLRGGVTW